MLAAALLAMLAPQTAPPAAARAWCESHSTEVLAEFRELLTLPNHARDLPGIRRNVEWLQEALRGRGAQTRVLEVRYASPVVYGAIDVPGATHTVVFYAHYDGQYADRSRWTTSDPFTPELYSGPIDAGGRPIGFDAAERGPEARIYARSAGDDKAAIIAILTALDALRDAGIRPSCNLRFFFEGEEEVGSPHLEQILRKYSELLAADLWIFCDGPVHQTRQQQVVFGVRGVTGLELTVYGARRELHSGHYGNWAPNPAMMLARLLATMVDAEGRVTIEGFYDDVRPLTEAEESALAAAPRTDELLRRELWLGDPEGSGERLERLINRPSLNVSGLQSAAVGRFRRNVVPAAATAALEVRLVPDMDQKRTVDLIVEHIRAQGFHVTETEPDEKVRRAHARVALVVRRRGYNAVRATMDSELGRAVVRAVESARGSVIQLPTLGGSLPLAAFEKVLGTPVLIVPIANHDDNQHAPDENLRLANLWEGIETMAALLAIRL